MATLDVALSARKRGGLRAAGAVGACHPVILCGGTGARLWPMSRTAYPKQLMPLVSELTLFQETLRRVEDRGRFNAPLIVCNDEHRFMIAEQMYQLGVAPAAIVLEPEARNTAPAAAVAATLLAAADPDAIMLVLPSDHYIAAREGFWDAVDRAMPAAKSGALVAFGIAPDHPETGYGYMRRGAPRRGCPGCFAVDGFVEKPDLATARKYLADGGYVWNSGIILLKAAQYLTELARFEPEMLATVQEAVKRAVCDFDFVRLDRTAFVAARACSLDYAVMEKTDATVVTPVEIGWTDVGSWDALWHATGKDRNGNALLGDVVSADVHNSYIRAESRLVAAVGLTDIVLVETADAVLAVARDRTQDLRQIVGRLAEAGRNERRHHRRVYRPWGSYEQIDSGDRHQVKRIIVKPGGRLSLQKHAHRCEHWVVVRGTARVTRGQDVFDLHENEAAYIAVGTVHRLENATPEHLHLIEVQTGDYLGEDDIVRLDDSYGRA